MGLKFESKFDLHPTLWLTLFAPLRKRNWIEVRPPSKHAPWQVPPVRQWSNSRIKLEVKMGLHHHGSVACLLTEFFVSSTSSRTFAIMLKTIIAANGAINPAEKSARGVHEP